MAIVAAVATILAAFAPSTANASQVMYGWQFATDIFCDTTLRSISMTGVGYSLSGAPAAAVSYRIAFRYNNGAWSSWSNWKTFNNQSIYWDGPRPMFSGSGTYQFQAQYAVYTTSGWAYGPAEYANHRYSAGGFTGNTSYTYCRV